MNAPRAHSSLSLAGFLLAGAAFLLARPAQAQTYDTTGIRAKIAACESASGASHGTDLCDGRQENAWYDTLAAAGDTAAMTWHKLPHPEPIKGAAEDTAGLRAKVDRCAASGPDDFCHFDTNGWNDTLAAAGDTAAMLRLAVAYDGGPEAYMKEEAGADLAVARLWYHEAAQAGAKAALAPLARWKERGFGGEPPDSAAALALYERGAAAGDPLAAERLGEYRLLGLADQRRDAAGALTLFRKALAPYLRMDGQDPAHQGSYEVDRGGLFGCRTCWTFDVYQQRFATGLFHLGLVRWEAERGRPAPDSAALRFDARMMQLGATDSAKAAPRVGALVRTLRRLDGTLATGAAPSSLEEALARAQGAADAPDTIGEGARIAARLAQYRKARKARLADRCGGTCNAWTDMRARSTYPGTSLDFAGTTWQVANADPNDTTARPMPVLPAGGLVALVPGIRSGTYYLWVEGNGYTTVRPVEGAGPTAPPDAHSIAVKVVRANRQTLTTDSGWILHVAPPRRRDLYQKMFGEAPRGWGHPSQWDLPTGLAYLTGGEVLGPGGPDGQGILIHVTDYTAPAGGS